MNPHDRKRRPLPGAAPCAVRTPLVLVPDEAPEPWEAAMAEGRYEEAAGLAQAALEAAEAACEEARRRVLASTVLAGESPQDAFTSLYGALEPPPCV